MRRGTVAVAVGSVIATVAAGVAGGVLAPHAKAAPVPYSVYVGYASSGANPANFPTPWVGSPTVLFEGCIPNCAFDGGAVEVVNNGAAALTVDSVVISFSPACVYDIWPHGVSLPAGDQLIVTETASGELDGCGPTTGIMDSSEIGPNGQGWANSCIQSGVVPQVAVSVNGASTTFNDTGQVLNTGGEDAAFCQQAGYPSGNESEPWTLIGGQPCLGATATAAPSTQSFAPGHTATVTATFKNGCGQALAGAPVAFAVSSGPNAGNTASATTNATGVATFTDSSAAFGIDTIRASVSNPSGAIQANPATVVWKNATITLSPLSGIPGTLVNAKGTGFTSGEAVNLSYASPAGQIGQNLASATVHKNGSFSTKFTVPVPTAANLPTSGAVVGIGATSGREGWAQFTLQCTDDWTKNGNGSWTAAASWSTGAVPTASDAACVVLGGANYTVTISSSVSVASLIVGAASGTTTQKLRVQANATHGDVHLALGGSSRVNSRGVLILDSKSSNSSFLDGPGALANSGTLSTVAGSGGSRVIHTAVTNNAAGTLSIAAPNTVQDASTGTTNMGALSVAAAGSLALSGGSTLAQAGGTLSNAGSVTVTNATLSVTGGALSGSAPVLNGGASLIEAGGAGSGAVLVECLGNTLSGTVASGQSVTVLGNDTCGDAQLSVNSATTNGGTLALDSSSAGSNSILDGTGTLTNSGTLSTVQDAGSSRYLRVTLDNASAGTVSIGGAGTHQDAGTTTTNSGTFTVTAGGGYIVEGGSHFTQGTASTLNVVVDANANTAYGLLGNATITLGGTLGVTTLGTPSSGETFTVITGGAISGTFGTVNSAVSYTVAYTSTTVKLTA